jgi:hypothetical protein
VLSDVRERRRAARAVLTLAPLGVPVEAAELAGRDQDAAGCMADEATLVAVANPLAPARAANALARWAGW